MKKIILILLSILILIALAYFSSSLWMPLLFEPTDTTLKQGKTVEEVMERSDQENLKDRTTKQEKRSKQKDETPQQEQKTISDNENQPKEKAGREDSEPKKQDQQKDESEEPIQVVAKNLNIPWEIAFLPGGDLLVTERPGTLKRLGEKEKGYQLEDTYHIGEGGLLGLALHPDFKDNRYIYLYLTTNNNGENIENQIRRYKYTESGRLKKERVILADIPAGRWHNGGRIEFGPDELLYITTGDAQQENLSQNKKSLAGKILRITDTGKTPKENPFSNPVFSFGHRNPQGLAWTDSGHMWATEHGSSARDELNLIEKGANYGWPIIQGDQSKPGMKTPKVHSGSSETWAPAGAEYYNGSIFFSGLRGETLYEAKLSSKTEIKEVVAHFRQDYGRLRHVEQGPDGYIYILTSNRDGRGSPVAADDRIIKIDPEVFKE
ncbi:MAG: sorbosone dehydrogenase family protein [Candidatus Paceibacteria bacterium]